LVLFYCDSVWEQKRNLDTYTHTEGRQFENTEETHCEHEDSCVHDEKGSLEHILPHCLPVKLLYQCPEFRFQVSRTARQGISVAKPHGLW
jgi:hypothetical protein